MSVLSVFFLIFIQLFIFLELVEDLVGGSFQIHFGEEDSVYRLIFFLFSFIFVSPIIYILIITLLTVPIIDPVISQCSSPQSVSSLRG